MSEDEFKRMMAALSAEFREGLSERIAGIDELWRRTTEGVNPVESMGELLKALHTLAGSAGTFGLDEVGNTAATAESCLQSYRESGTVPDEVGKAEISRLLEALRRAVSA